LYTKSQGSLVNLDQVKCGVRQMLLSRSSARNPGIGIIMIIMFHVSMLGKVCELGVQAFTFRPGVAMRWHCYFAVLATTPLLTSCVYLSQQSAPTHAQRPHFLSW
jgi:hypothetical protein